MFDHFDRAWQLARKSGLVLGKDPELLCYPLLSCIGMLALISSNYSQVLGGQPEEVLCCALFGLLFLFITMKNFWDVAQRDRHAHLGNGFGRSTGQRECPSCQTLLASRKVAEFAVDQCPQCGGIFWDRGELPQLQG